MLYKFLLLIGCIFMVEQSVYAKQQKPVTEKRVGRKVANAPSLSAEQSLVVQYFKCFDTNNKPEIVPKCVYPLLSTNLSESEKNRFVSWLLIYPFHISDFSVCTKRRLDEIRFFPLASEKFICADIEMDWQKKQAVFFFESYKQSFLLKSIYY